MQPAGHLVCMVAIEERARRIDVNDDEHSFHSAELLLRIMYGTKFLNSFFIFHEASEALKNM